MIKVDNILKQFDDRVVLNHISAEFLPGRCNLIIGKSGAGKSVFMKCLIGLIEPDEGNIYYDGVALNSLQKKQILELRRKTGMLFQGSALFDSMTVFENVMFPQEMFAQTSISKMKERTKELLNMVNLSEASNKYPSEISGGMMKRVAIARAIALSPRYLFCDEPNSGLDPMTSLMIDNLIQKITRDFNITTIINTHDMNTVKTIGDQILFLNKGQIEWRGTSENILTESPLIVQNFINTIDE